MRAGWERGFEDELLKDLKARARINQFAPTHPAPVP